MTAVSPYAVPKRNPSLRHSSSTTSLQLGTKGGGVAIFALFWLAVRFWTHGTNRESVLTFLRQKPSFLLHWCKGLLGWENLPSDDKQASTNTETSTFPRNVVFDGSFFRSKDKDAILRMQENHHLIQSVLMYWFGQYSPDNSQKKLWMIANSSVQLREQVDKTISEKFGGLLLELSGTSSSTRWSEWCLDGDNNLYGYRGKMAAIIVLDQFSRHMKRHYHSMEMEHELPSQDLLDARALESAKLLVNVHSAEIQSGMIPQPMYIFALMPYRHASTIESVEYVQRCIEECADMSTQMEAMLGRFRKATNRRMAVLQDQARRTQRAKPQEDETQTANTHSESFTDEDILETFPFQADMSLSLNHPIHKTIVGFLEDRGIGRVKDGNSPSSSSPIIVSLSGGVDSMVIASVLANLNKSCGYNMEIIAVHIDYANRPESAAEADFVRRYSEDLGITFRCRRIDEVTRGVTARDDYERIARELRYSSYREAIAHARHGSDKDMTIGVMLGHHKGDLRENVLSNAHKGCGPLDLSGMTAVSTNDGVVIYRPLLPLEKSFVFDYAHKFGVPYFKDTTPHWSTRGKLRNKLLPLLEEIYGEGSMKNLSNLAIESDECRALVQSAIIGPFLDGVERRPMGISFDTAPWKNQSVVCWKFMLREALHSAKFGMFSDKSVMAFLERIQAEKLHAGWLQCRRDYAVYLQEDGRVFVLYPSSFPFSEKDKYKLQNKPVPFDKDVLVGPWVIKADIVSEKADCPETFRLAQKAIPSMDHLMNGTIEYWLNVPTWFHGNKFVPRPLVFCRFTKASRPMAWKNNESDRNLSLKVQETLPLLGNDEIALAAIQQGTKKLHTDTGNNPDETNPIRLVRVSMRIARK